ncbi:MAG TPA: rRNA maturation RNase YbeY [Candidatus Eremiobacteraceae bacterium]|nr:rRNA maturation RNase YbeY [Candidatus Eremiobacteraceae bacterium]
MRIAEMPWREGVALSGRSEAAKAAEDSGGRQVFPESPRAREGDSPRAKAKTTPTAAVRGAARWRIDVKPLKAAVIATLRKAAPHIVGEVAVILTGDKEIRRLNKRYRAKDSATDVLSFDVDDGLSAGEPFGDVVVSVETARRQARAYGAPLIEEMQRLIVHGTLHLCGYDHHERREAARMHGLTRRLMRDLTAEDDHR